MCWQCGTAHIRQLHAAAAAIDQYILSAWPSAANGSSEFAAVGSCWDRRTGTDGRTPYRFIDPAPHTMRTVPIRVNSFLTYGLITLRSSSVDGSRYAVWRGSNVSVPSIGGKTRNISVINFHYLRRRLTGQCFDCHLFVCQFFWL